MDRYAVSLRRRVQMAAGVRKVAPAEVRRGAQTAPRQRVTADRCGKQGHDNDRPNRRRTSNHRASLPPTSLCWLPRRVECRLRDRQ